MTASVGQTLPEFRIASVSAEAMKVWAQALHDPNPIHLDPAMVAAKGLGNRVINQGPANLAYVINMAMIAFPGSMITELDVRYLDNVFAGDSVVASGTVSAVQAQQDFHHAVCDVMLTKMGGLPVISGTVSLRIPN